MKEVITYVQMLVDSASIALNQSTTNITMVIAALIWLYPLQQLVVCVVHSTVLIPAGSNRR